MSASPVTLAVVGAGDRGRTYAEYARRWPRRARVVAVAEPSGERRAAFADRHSIPADAVFRDWRELAGRPRMADAVLICTLDAQHREPALALLDLGYHVLLEKPMAPTLPECEQIAAAAHAAARRHGSMFAVAHVLRYTSYTRALRRLLDAGAIGDLISMQHIEPIGFWHMAHAFVRGNWRKEADSSFMLLAKSCHDMDWMSHIFGVPCERVSSFGSLQHFRRSKAPRGSAARCVRCSVERSCPYSAPRIYGGFLRQGLRDWPLSVVTPDPTPASLRRALESGPYGRCVYRCDNDMVDHQVVALEFADGRAATFTLCAFTTRREGRRSRLFGTHGEIQGDSETITVDNFRTGHRRIVDTRKKSRLSLEGHGGGDFGVVHAFVHAVASGDTSQILSGADATLESHRIAFAAERARREGRVVRLAEMKERGASCRIEP
ncbi:MAG: Gfo/Idh/MocA family oxidoreductase [Kiritimatiellae bacterium]|nr:Gfo/Idh/MocA family oxidoreductase [Kiritimatiellia bacterium]